MEMIPLADAIVALREQLGEARARGAGEDIQFAVGPIELELNLVATREAKAGGKIGFKLFGWGTDVSTEGSLGSERTHKLTLTLTPTLDGNEIKVHDSLGGGQQGAALEGGNGK